MFTVSVKIFRFACVAALIFLVCTALAHYLNIEAADANMGRALHWAYFEAIAPVWFIWGIFTTYVLLALVGLIGAMWFWEPARWCLAFSIALSAMTRPLLGLVVMSPLAATLMGLYGLAHVFIVAVSFWSPLAHRFKKV